MAIQLYYNGPILTMENPAPAEALLTENGRILYTGTMAQASALAAGAEKIDLAGKTLMPAFLDAHGHFFAYANNFLQAALDGAADFQEIKKRLLRYAEENHIRPGEWIIAKGYDHNMLAEGRHPDAAFIDSFLPDNPVVLHHQSGHMGVFNSKALSALQVSGSTPSPAGGRIAVENGKATGYMEENAFVEYVKKVPLPGMDKILEACKKAQKAYAARGITTVQDGMLVNEMAPIFRRLLTEDLLYLDLVAYADFQQREAISAQFSDHIQRYCRHFKLGGFKIFLDGSPQGRTAWMRTPYQPESEQHFGTSTMTDEAVEAALETAARENMQLLAHCNGDAACAQYIQAAQKAIQNGRDLASIRPVLIHGQLLGPDQIPALRKNSLLPSFFVAHVYHWGDVHIQNFGLARAAKISPAASALRAGLPFTFHQDSPVIEPDMLETVWCAVSRQTKNGVTLGKEEGISVYAALQAVTVNAAYQYFEENEKGSLRPGKSADFILLDQNPLTAETSRLRSIQILETVKTGKTIYRQ